MSLFVINKNSLKIIGLLIACAIIANIIIWKKYPTAIIKIYKTIYIKYIRITKSNFTSRFNQTELKEAINYAKKQSWVLEQISQDLAPFKNGITEQQINYWFKILQQNNSNRLVKFIVKNNTVQVDSPKEFFALRPFKTIYDVIFILANNKQIPDCQFIVSLHDYLEYIPPDITEPAAIFTFAKDTRIPIEKTTILIPDWMNLRYWNVLRGRIRFANYLFPYAQKKNLIHWRGGMADSMQHRNKLINLGKRLNILDVGFTEGNNHAPRVDPELSLQYKYQIALDGARCTWERIIWQMSSNTVLIKPNSPQIQWFYKGLKPYENYVPITDINEQEILTVYNWLQNNNIKAQEIAYNANLFAKNNFKTQDFFAYYAVLLQEYAKLFVKNTL